MEEGEPEQNETDFIVNPPSFTNLTFRSKVNIVANIAVDVIQITAGIVALALANSSDSCHFLKVYIYVYIIRLFILFPLTVQYLLYHRNSSGELLDDSNTATGRIRTFGFLVLIIPLFIIGNIGCFSPKLWSCRIDSPLLYYTSLSYTIYTYLIINIPLMLIYLTFMVFCIYYFCCGVHLTDIPKPSGLPSQLLESIPERIFTKAATSEDTEKMKAETIKRNSIHSIKDDDAVCAICLGDYEEGEKIKRLPCRHHFHASCINEWLTKNEKCPLCMRKMGEELKKNHIEIQMDDLRNNIQ